MCRLGPRTMALISEMEGGIQILIVAAIVAGIE